MMWFRRKNSKRVDKNEVIPKHFVKMASRFTGVGCWPTPQLHRGPASVVFFFATQPRIFGVKAAPTNSCRARDTCPSFTRLHALRPRVIRHHLSSGSVQWDYCPLPGGRGTSQGVCRLWPSVSETNFGQYLCLANVGIARTPQPPSPGPPSTGPAST